MAAVTNNDFLKSKIKGFCDFLEVALHERISHERFAEARGKLAELRACDVGHFILYVSTEICPRKTNIKSYNNNNQKTKSIYTTVKEV